MTARNKTKVGNEKKYALIIGTALVLIIAAVLIFAFSGSSGEVSADELKETEFFEGVSIAGVDVSGMTISEAEPLIRQQAEELLNSLNISYSVEDTVYPVTAYELGAYVDHISVMTEAMMLGRTGSLSEKSEQKRLAKEEGTDFPLQITADRKTAEAALERHGALYNKEPKDACVRVSVNQSSDTLNCSGELVFEEDEDGLTVDAAKLADELCSAAENEMNTAVIQASLDTTQAALTLETLEQNCVLMGQFSTTFETSAYGRRFNIWKMSTVINGVVLQPGEQWSINEAAGDRTTANGWADAAGIKNGAYVDEPGGGICQVSTTLYGAVLRSELTVVERKHHSWPSAYVPVGLDATISTGAPDFIFANPYDYPIVVIANTDAKDARRIKVSIYGPPMDYKLDFTSEIVKETEPKPASTTFDPSLSPGTSVQVKPTKTGKVANVYKHYYDKETGEEIREPELIYTDTYSAFSGLVAYGPSLDPNATLPPPTAEPDGEVPDEAAPSPAPSQALDAEE